MEQTNVIKVRFIKDLQPDGREYTYRTPERVEVGDIVDVETSHGIAQAQVSRTDVPVAEIERWADRAKSVIGKTKCRCEDCAEFTPIGEGDHICGANPTKIPVSDYAPTEDYLWCKGSFFHAE